MNWNDGSEDYNTIWRLKKALIRYGKHDNECPAKGGDYRLCNCGLSEDLLRDATE